MKNVLMLLAACCFLFEAMAQNHVDGEPLGDVKPKSFHQDDPRSKLRPSLLDLEQEYLNAVVRGIAPEEFISEQKLVMLHNGMVRIEASARIDARILLRQLEELSVSGVDVYERIINAWIPIENISRLSELSELLFVKQVYYVKGDIGSATSEGDVALEAEAARDAYCVDGSGILIGVLSDSYTTRFPNGAANGVASGDIPGVGNPNGFTTPVTVVQDGAANNIDEGRAMIEIIHDLAPGAQLFFNTTNGGQATYATAILNLDAVSNCDVIVDDVRYFEEPFYMDGIIAQACNTVFNNGKAYFASAGNYAQRSYESVYRDSDGASNAHNFDPDGGIDTLQRFTVNAGSPINIILQWDDPWGSMTPNGAATNLDLFLVNNAGTIVASSTDNNIGADPTELITYTDQNLNFTVTYSLLITRTSGPPPSMLKWVMRNTQGLVINEYPPTTINALATGYGHSNATGANAVGAAWWSNTPAFGVNPPQPEAFTSSGGVQIRYNTAGQPITPVTRNKPEFTAVDGVSNTFFGQGNNFFGTSAAAPHAAAIAALMLEANGNLTPTSIRNMLVSSCIDMLTPGFDFVTGAGLMQTDAAVQSAVEQSCNITSVGVQSGPTCTGDGLYNVTLRINYTNPPGCSDQLSVNGVVFEAPGASFTDVTLTGLPANGNNFSVTVFFVSASGCSLLNNNVFTAPKAPVGTNTTKDILCSGDAFNISLQSKINNGVNSNFSWTVNYNGLTGGFGNSSGAFINETLVNSTGDMQSAVYTITPTSQIDGCEGVDFILTVTVPPLLEIEAGSNQTIFYYDPLDACTDLEATGMAGGVPPYTITWSVNGFNIGSGEDITVCMANKVDTVTTVVYTVTITDDNGCTETDELSVCYVDIRCQQGNSKQTHVIICHIPPDNPSNTQTLCVSLNALADHMSHGDYVFICDWVSPCDDANSKMARHLEELISNPISNGNALLDAYPNPFNSSTTIRFSVADEQRASLKVYDITGRFVMDLFEGTMQANQVYEVQLDGSSLAAGSYFYRLATDDGGMNVKKLMLAR